MLVTARNPRPVREIVVFSGKLAMRRDKVAAAVAAAGRGVAVNVSAQTTMLVIGVQDPKQLVAGYDKSTKERKAESLIASGYKIRIVDEAEFWRLLEAAK